MIHSSLDWTNLGLSIRVTSEKSSIIPIPIILNFVSLTPDRGSIVPDLLNSLVLLFILLGMNILGACKMALSKHTILTTFHGALMGVRNMNLEFSEG